MRIPERHLGDWAQDLASRCNATTMERATRHQFWSRLYFTGNSQIPNPSLYNKSGAHVRRLAAMLYTPSDARWGISYDQQVSDREIQIGLVAALALTTEIHSSSTDWEISEALRWSLISGASLIKLLWSQMDGLEPYVVQNPSFGVLQENVNRLERQEAVCHTTWITRNQLRDRLKGDPESESLLSAVQTAVDQRSPEDEQNIVHQLILSGSTKVSSASSGTSIVGVFGQPSPNIPRSTLQEMVLLRELWVWDDDRKDYTTIQLIEPNIILEGAKVRRNLFANSNLPFVLIQPNRVDGYFFGRSELADLEPLQRMLSERLESIDRIWKLRAKPPRAFIGFSGLNEEKRRSLVTPGGWISEPTPNAKVENLAPELPPEAFQQITQILDFYDDLSGFQPILRGEGEPGVRAGTHAQMLSRNASPALKERTLLVERQAGQVGHIALKLMQKEVDNVFVTASGERFQLDQLREGWIASIDSHSSSPLFAAEEINTAISLFKAGALDKQDLLDMLLKHSSHADNIKLKLRKREAAQAQLLQQHPELLTKGKPRR